MNTRAESIELRSSKERRSARSAVFRDVWARQIVRRGLNAVSIAGLLFVWEMVARSGYFNTALFPPPSKVAIDLFHMMAGHQLWSDIFASSRRLFVGYVAGGVAGLVAGLFTGRYSFADHLLSPAFQVLRPIPPISFVPVAILWFGLGEFSKYFLVFWGVFFPVWFNTYLGVQRVDQTLTRAAQCLGAKEGALLFAVVLPGALPQILAGLRTALAVSFYCLVAAEIAGAYSGVAYRIDIAHLNFQIGHMFAGLGVLGVMSALADWLFVRLTGLVFPWAYRKP
jgi:ABC-type nitrate/sulfonate/bicarbonate transport system permease component